METIQCPQMLDLANKDLKATTINMFKELKQAMLKEKSDINEQRFLIRTQMYFKKTQIKILMLKNIIKMKSSPEELSSRYKMEESVNLRINQQK